MNFREFSTRDRINYLLQKYEPVLRRQSKQTFIDEYDYYVSAGP